LLVVVVEVGITQAQHMVARAVAVRVATEQVQELLVVVLLLKVL